MTSKTQSRRALLTNIGKGTAIATGGVALGSTTAAARGKPSLEVKDVSGDYELVDAPRRKIGPMPYQRGFTIKYSIPSEYSPLNIATDVDSAKSGEKTEAWRLSGSGTFTAWGSKGLPGIDYVKIRAANTGWRRRVFGP